MRIQAPHLILPSAPSLQVALALLAVGMLATPQLHGGAEPDRYVDRRQAMVDGQIRDRGVSNSAVLLAMKAVPRHEFVQPQHQRYAYTDQPLPIGHGQTISQPYIVGLMTELLQVQPGQKVLEVGTGSGYQAAVLAQLTTNVYTIEIVKPLAEQAKKRLFQHGLNEEQVKEGDGYFGWPDQAPFDGIIVTAAADHIPPPLLKQLRPGGRMVIPIGPVHATQRLVLVEKGQRGQVTSKTVLPVRFVPLTGGRSQRKEP